MEDKKKNTPPDSWFRNGATAQEKTYVPDAMINYIHQHKMDVSKLKRTNLFVRGICEKMSFYNPNWETMLTDSRHTKCARFKYINNYVKEALKDRQAIQAKVDSINDDLSHMM